MAIRNKLHYKHIEDFKKYLINNGYTIKQPKMIYEVIRATKDNDLVVIYSKLNSKEHLTVQQKDINLVNQFFSERIPK